MKMDDKLMRETYIAAESHYNLLEEVGYGATATVYRAIYLPTHEVVAVKCLDLDRCNSNLDDVRREAQTMSLIDHPTIIRAHCSFVVDRCLWVVMPFMGGGSCLHIMKSAYPNGLEEPIISKVLKQTLKALDYLHCQGHIHRDVKAGNILVDTSGAVKLGDFGVSACMFDKGDRQRSRNTFVGTPCWMAPEVLQPGSGYDFKADIWSLGITALELAHGHAPFSKYPPMKVLLMTIQNAPPGLDYDRDKKFSKSFKEMIAMCLVKDPTKRPTAKKLLKHSFFKHKKSPDYVAYNLLHGLPPLWERVKALQLKDAEQLALKKMPSGEQELRSQDEYKRGVSAWNFDIDDLKYQAALIQDDNESLGEMEVDVEVGANMKNNNEQLHSFFPQNLFSSGSEIVQSYGMPGPSTNEDSKEAQSELKPALMKSASINNMSNMSDLKTSGSKETIGSRDFAIPDADEDFGFSDNPKINRKKHSINIGKDRHDEKIVPRDCDLEQNNNKNLGSQSRQAHSGMFALDRIPSLGNEKDQDYERDKNSQQSNWREPFRNHLQKENIFTGPLLLPRRASANSLSAPSRSSGGFRDYPDIRSKASIIQRKGRFSVTSIDIDLVESPTLQKFVGANDCVLDQKQIVIPQLPKDTVNNGSVPAAVLVPHLQSLLQQTVSQQDSIVSLLSSLHNKEATVAAHENAKCSTQIPNGGSDIPVETTTEREQVLQSKIVELQAKILSLTNESRAIKAKNIQLQKQLIAIYNKEEAEMIQQEDS